MEKREIKERGKRDREKREGKERGKRERESA